MHDTCILIYIYECVCGTGVYILCVFIHIWRKGLVDAREGEDGIVCFYIHIWRKGSVDAGEGEDIVSIYYNIGGRDWLSWMMGEDGVYVFTY